MFRVPSISGLFKWRQFEPEVILLAVGWYLRFSLSYREVEELLAERGLWVDHVIVWRWVQRYAPELQRRLRRHLKPTSDSWRVDETYIRIKGKWRYLYRAVDSTGATLDFLLSAKQDAAAAKRFLAKALGQQNHPAPRVINTDGHAAYPPAIAQLKSEGTLDSDCQHRPVPYLNNVSEQDHRPSSGGLTPARVSVLFGLPGARWPATRQSTCSAKAKRAEVRRRGSVCSIALLLVRLELKSDSFSYRTQLHSIPKLQHYPLIRVP